MDFQLSEDQQALRDGIRSFCEDRFSFDALRELEQKQVPLRERWSELAEMGIFALRRPESEGGVGLGYADAALVFAELGRRLVPGPLVWSHLLAGRVEGAASGQAIVGGLDRIGSGGGPLLVEHLDQLDALVVLEPGGVIQIAPRSLDATPVATPLDPLTPIHQLAALPEGQRIGSAELSARLRLEGGALAAAQLLGVAEMAQELATEYARRREQFGRPIGGFQAIKHILADAFTRQELARAAVYVAGLTLDTPEVGDPVRAVSTAKLVAGEAAMKNARACVQVHGGMGYTWEMPAHYYLKRSWVLENLFGTVEEHAERMAEHVAAGI